MKLGPPNDRNWNFRKILRPNRTLKRFWRRSGCHPLRRGKHRHREELIDRAARFWSGGSFAGAADGHVGGAPSHQQLPGDLEPVFAAMLEKAVRICDATFGNVFRWDGKSFSLLSAHNTPAAFVDYRKRAPHVLPDPLCAFGRILATKEAVHVADATTLAGYVERSLPGCCCCRTCWHTVVSFRADAKGG